MCGVSSPPCVYVKFSFLGHSAQSFCAVRARSRTHQIHLHMDMDMRAQVKGGIRGGFPRGAKANMKQKTC